MRFTWGEDAAPGEDVPDGREPKVREQAAELALRAVSIDRMAEPAEPADAHPRLVDVQLPGMEVDDGGLALPVIEMLDGASGHPVRQEPEVSAPGDRQAASKHGDGREREFGDAVPVGDGHAVWKPWSVRDAVPIVSDGEDAGVVQEAGLPENLQAPESLPDHGERGGAVPDHGHAGGVLDRGLGLLQILGELQARLAVDHLVPIAVAGDFVASASDVLDERRVPVGDPAEDEEGSPDIGIVEDVEEALGRVHDATGQAGPLLRREGAGEDLRMEVLLDVERQRVLHPA